MFVIRATQKLLDRINPATLETSPVSTTVLGDWYATAVFWQPRVALFVNESILLPILIPLAPAAGLPNRFPPYVAATLAAHGAPEDVIAAELEQMRDYQVAKTASRSVVGIMNEFIRLAEITLDRSPAPCDLPDLAARLARTPCSPLYRSHISPDRALTALIHTHSGQDH